MARYALLQLNDGTMFGHRILSTQMMAELHRPEINVAVDWRPAARAIYTLNSASCHGAILEEGRSFPLSGATFEARWEDEKHSVDDLFYILRTLMPYEKPATLSKQEYIDIIAYLLMMNGHPAGAQGFPLDTSVLEA